MLTIFDCLSAEDRELTAGYLGSLDREPDLIISPDGAPYLYRWHVAKNQKAANTYFHLQVADDPERPLHDHPWDNMSVILSGGYREMLNTMPWVPLRLPIAQERVKGDVIFRHAHHAHRLFLPKSFKYTLTLFSTGPRVREWGFWYEHRFVPYTEVCELHENVTVHRKPKGDMS